MRIEVVAAIIKNDQAILCVKRPNTGELGNSWEFPGGKVEQSESLREALVREIHEELSSEIKIESFFMTVKHQYKTFHLTMHCYLCSLLSDQITLNEHIDSCWLNINELDRLDWAPADIQVVNKLQKEWENINGKSNKTGCI